MPCKLWNLAEILQYFLRARAHARARKGASIRVTLTEIAKVAEPGAVFGELSVLLGQPHTADVHALETSQFHIANATALLAQNPIAALYVATVLAHRLDGVNHALIQLKKQLQTGETYSVVTKTVTRMYGLLVVGDEFLDD